jgi:glucose-6-phosphate dehydrogenase assembly protein OpcA
MSATIEPEKILRELSELWVSLGKDADHGQSSGVLRACSMTLVTLVEESEDPTDVWSTMAALMPEHPSRAIVIRFRPSAERELASRVFSQCWMPFGHRRQICCEQIEIMASDASLPDLAAVVLPLAVADLPVMLWCRSVRLFSLPDFPQLTKIAHKLVLDSAAFPDSAAALALIDERSRSGQILGDLAWTRLTRWRGLVSQIFESRKYLARLPEIAEIRVGFGGATPPAGAYYLSAWLLDCLGKAGARPRVTWASAPDAPAGHLSQIELLGGQALRVSISVTGDREHPTALVQVDSLSNRTVFPPDNDYMLLREELSIPNRDPVYDRTLAGAARLSQAQN